MPKSYSNVVYNDILDSISKIYSANKIQSFEYKMLLDNLSYMILITDEDDKIIYLNNKVKKFFFTNIQLDLIGKKTNCFYELNKSETPNWYSFGNQKINIDHTTEYIFGEKYDLRFFTKEITNGIKKEFITLITAEMLGREYLSTADLLNEYRAVWDISFDSMRILDQEGKFIAVNKSFCKLIEKESDELIGKDYTYIYSNEDSQPSIIFELVDVRPVFEREVVLWNGKNYWFEIISKIITYKTGEKVVLSIFKNITDSKNVISKLHESEAKFQEMTDLLPQIIFETDSKGFLTYCNKYSRLLFNIDLDRDISSLNILQFIADEDKVRAKENISKKYEKSANSNNEYTLVSPEGNRFPVIIFSSLIVKDDKPVGLRGIIIDISERKRLEDSIRKSESLYRGIIDTSPDGISLLDIDGNIIFSNNRKAQMFGYSSPNDLIGINAFSFIDKEFLPLVNENYFKLLKTGFVENLQFKCAKKDGTLFWVEFRARLIYDKNNKPLNIMYVVTDISNKIIAQEESRLNELRLETLIKLNKLIDTTETVISDFVLKEAALQTNSEFGYIVIFDNNNSVVSVRLFEHSNYFNIPVKEINDVLSNKSSFWYSSININTPLIENDLTSNLSNSEMIPGTDVIIRKILSIPIFENGKTQFIIGVLNKKTDYSDLDKNHISLLAAGLLHSMQLNRSEKQLRTLRKAIEQNPSIIVITSPSGDIEYTNPKFTEITGYSFDEVMGKNPRILKSGNTPTEVYADLWNTVLSGRIWSGEFLNKKKNGELYWESIQISPIIDEQGAITDLLAIKQDISEKKSIEKQLIEAKEKAEKSEKLKSEFLAQMSHEIRTPINVILSFSSLIKEEIGGFLNDDLRSSFNIMTRAGERIIRTIDLILNMSELQTGTYDFQAKEINLKEEIIKPLILEHSKFAQNKGLDLIFNCMTEKVIINGDEYSVSQIFTNLLENAIKFTDYGNITINLNNNNNGIFIEIIDTGIGISDDYKPFLFSPFSQEEQGYTRKFEGNGLGLALVKQYCELNKADITVESKKGVGSTFVITFPHIDSK